MHEDKREIRVHNIEPQFPMQSHRKKNKNDFYRFLLQQNFEGDRLSEEDLAF
jgi:hypothetical protein